jgi:hypothetical protein
MLMRLSILRQLEVLRIRFYLESGSEEELFHIPITERTMVTLPNLRWLDFSGNSAYLEALLPSLTTPLLEKIQISFFGHSLHPIPHLLEFLTAAESLGLDSAKIAFCERDVVVRVYPNSGAKMHVLQLQVSCWYLSELEAITSTLNCLSPVFSTVESLTLIDMSAVNYVADDIMWQELLWTFSSVKHLAVPGRFVSRLSECLSLQPDRQDARVDLLPELKQLSYAATEDHSDTFSAFIDARQKAGFPVTLFKLPPSHFQQQTLRITIIDMYS